MFIVCFSTDLWRKKARKQQRRRTERRAGSRRMQPPQPETARHMRWKRECSGRRRKRRPLARNSKRRRPSANGRRNGRRRRKRSGSNASARRPNALRKSRVRSLLAQSVRARPKPIEPDPVLRSLCSRSAQVITHFVHEIFIRIKLHLRLGSICLY